VVLGYRCSTVLQEEYSYTESQEWYRGVGLQE